MSKQKVNLTQLAAQSKKKIESPLAKYSSSGQLFCALCNTQVKNEIYWTGHINGKAHRENLATLKKSSAPQQQHTFKRPLPASPSDSTASSAASTAAQPPPKKILKIIDKDEDNDDDDDDDDKPRSSSTAAVLKAEEDLKLMILGGVVGVSSNDKTAEDNNAEEETDNNSVEKPVINAASLPQGFFDDPKEDAKARGQKFRDPQDVEWDKFVKEIATEDIKSNEIVGVEQEKSAVERELEHIEEQMAQWQRVVDLEKKAIDYANQKKQKKNQQQQQGSNNNNQSLIEHMDVGESDNEEEDDDYDEELDWRNKKR